MWASSTPTKATASNLGLRDSTGKIDPYTTLDSGARYRHRRTGLGLALAVKNVLDRLYVSDRLPNGIFTAGFRQFFATLSWSSPSPD